MKKFLLFLVTLFVVFQATVFTPVSLSFSASQNFVSPKILLAATTPAATTPQAPAATTPTKVVIDSAANAGGNALGGIFSFLGGIEGIAVRVYAFILISIILPVFTLINELTVMIFNGLLDFSVDPSQLKSGSPIGDGIEFGWIIFRDILNIGIIFLLMFHAIKIILNREDQIDSGLIIKIILAGLLTNFSLFFIRVFIDISNIFIITIYSNITKLISPDLTIGENITTHFGAARLMDPNKWVGFNLQGGIKMLVIVYVSIALQIVSIYVFIQAIIVLATRVLVLVILMITSPIIFLGPVFKDIKELKKLNDDWWKELISQMIALPVFLIFLLVMVAIMNSSTFVDKMVTMFKSDKINLADYFLPLMVMGILYAASVFIKTQSSKWGQAVIDTVKSGAMAALAGTAALATGGAALGAKAASMAGNAELAKTFTGAQKMTGDFAGKIMPSTGNKFFDNRVKGALSDNGLLGVNTDGRTMLQRNFTDRLDNIDEVGDKALKAREKAQQDRIRKDVMKEYEKANGAHKDAAAAQSSVKEEMKSVETDAKIKAEATAIANSEIFRNNSALLTRAEQAQNEQNSAKQKMEGHRETIKTTTEERDSKKTEISKLDKSDEALRRGIDYANNEIARISAGPMDAAATARINKLRNQVQTSNFQIGVNANKRAAFKADSDRLDNMLATINNTMAGDQAILENKKAAVEAMFAELQNAGFSTDDMKDDSGNIVTDASKIAYNKVRDQKSREFSGMSWKELDKKEKDLAASAETKRQAALAKNKELFNGAKHEKELAKKLASELRIKIKTLSAEEYQRKVSKLMKSGKTLEEAEEVMTRLGLRFKSLANPKPDDDTDDDD
jgi:hypothetical protein